jgi:hypothetical protein
MAPTTRTTKYPGTDKRKTAPEATPEGASKRLAVVFEKEQHGNGDESSEPEFLSTGRTTTGNQPDTAAAADNDSSTDETALLPAKTSKHAKANQQDTGSDLSLGLDYQRTSAVEKRKKREPSKFGIFFFHHTLHHCPEDRPLAC